MKRLIKIMLLNVLLSGQIAWGWSIAVHRMISTHSYELLNSETTSKVHHLLDIFAQQHPEFFLEDWDYQRKFAELGTWMDTLDAEQGPRPYYNWHYISISYEVEQADDNTFQIPEAFNALTAIMQAQQQLQQSSDEQEQALNLAFLSHIITDIHQPLHTIELFSDEFPEGNQGGNLVQVKPANSKAMNLHRYWDRALQIPLTELYQLTIVCTVDNTQPVDWIKESHDLAKQFVYHDNGQFIDYHLSQDYVDKGQEIALQRIQLAACRLADTLNDLINS